MATLITGGAGYIGSHAARRLLEQGEDVVIIDNLTRGNRGAVAALQTLKGGTLKFVHADVRDRETMTKTLRERRIDAVLHFAALAYVRESVEQPLAYHDNNTAGSIALLAACRDAGCVERFVFSSTCATYGAPDPARIPIDEECPQHPINPYGWSKLHVERVLEDFQAAMLSLDKPFAFARLRYFNVAGADQQGLLGEDHDPETHLIPIAIFAALGRREPLKILGTDRDTPDGTCVRDYIHVDDLVDAHVAALGALDPSREDRRALSYNLGIGKGYSVYDVVKAVERVSGKPVPFEEGPGHAADPPTLTTNPSKIRDELGWSARVTSLDAIVETALRWFVEHPQGYNK